MLAGISHRTPVPQLRNLERDETTRRRGYARTTPQVEYALTRLGADHELVLLATHDGRRTYSGRTSPDRREPLPVARGRLPARAAGSRHNEPISVSDRASSSPPTPEPEAPPASARAPGSAHSQ
ncbi:MAG: winged helix-turn-helix transcriptional regulator [Phycisphaerales bacterium]|nr:winged helix-turn-helix transcriptional regulator [Phycisphaerales bacterium]